jgi:hypothetical protein
MPNEPGDTMQDMWPRPGKEDRIDDTPDLSKPYCPICEPVIDLDRIVRPVLCSNHQEPPKGNADEQVTIEGYISGTSESRGESNRILADLLRDPEV